MTTHRLLLGLLWAPFLLPGVASSQSQSWKESPQQAFLEGPIVRKYQCVTCHTIADQGGTVGPILNLVGLRRSSEWLAEWLEDPNAVKPGTKMPRFPFEDGELEQTVASLSRMTRQLQTESILATGHTPAETGERLFRDYDCLACHRIGDEGRFVGPDLTWVGIRKSEAWERIWLRDPQAFKPGTFMPSFHIPEEGLAPLARYLHTLQGERNEAGQEWEYMISFTINTTPSYRGEMVWKRLACWSCHGENGRGGIQNPNAAGGHELVPNLRGVRDAYSADELLAKITAGTRTPAGDPDAVPGPYDCPAYPEDALDRQNLEDLYAFISSFAPPKSSWTIR